MNKQRLTIYLEDHFALLCGESELATRCYENNYRSCLGDFLLQLQKDLEAQQEIVKQVQANLGYSKGIQGQIKQGTAWLAEKLGRLKPNDSLLEYSDLSCVVELEVLSAAAQERIALWNTLNVIRTAIVSLGQFEFANQIEETKKHLKSLQTFHQEAITVAFL